MFSNTHLGAHDLRVPFTHRVAMPEMSRPLLVLDVEVEQERVTELCAIRFDGVGVPTALWSRVNPGYPLSHWRQRNRRRLGLDPVDPDLVAMAPTMRDLSPELLHLAHGATVVAHNASYDRRHVRRELARWDVDWSHPHLCSLRLAKLLLPDHDDSYSLGSLASELGILNPAPHTAGGDAVTLVGVFACMMARHSQDPDLAEKLRASTTPSSSVVTR